MLWWLASGSYGNCEKFVKFWNRLAVIKAVRNDAERQGLRFCERVSPGCSIDHHAGQIWNFGNPAPIIFSLYFDFHIVDLQGVDCSNPA